MDQKNKEPRKEITVQEVKSKKRIKRVYSFAGSNPSKPPQLGSVNLYGRMGILQSEEK